MSGDVKNKEKLIRIVTNQSRLAASRPDDPEFLDRVQAALDEWEVELARQGISVEPVYTDSLAGGSRSDEAKRIRQHLIQSQEQKRADYALILGGDGIIPFYRLLDPVMELIAEADYWAQENDRLIYSDDPYVSYDDIYLYKPKHPIGRLPHGRGGCDDLIIELLQRSTRCHRERWAPVRRVAFTTQSWRSKSQLTWPEAQRWYECPPWRLPPCYDSAPTCAVGYEFLADKTCFVERDLLADKTLHYYNLHGQKNKNWLGECACEGMLNAQQHSLPVIPCVPPALSVAQIPPLPAAIVFSSACYGGFITRSEPPRGLQNLVLGFLRQGAIVFIGATARAYTEIYPIESLKYSDLLAQTFLKLVEENQTALSQRRIGEIVQAVKNDYQLGYNPSPLDFKTLWEFVLYGDPTLIPFRSAATQEKVYDSNRQKTAREPNNA